MSLQSIANKFVEMCNQAKNFDVMKEMYSDDIVSVEAGGNETVGKVAVIEKSAKWAQGIEIHGEVCKGPFFNGATQFAVIFQFDVTPKATGVRAVQEEVGVYTVVNDKITREVFYYQGKW